MDCEYVRVCDEAAQRAAVQVAQVMQVVLEEHDQGLAAGQYAVFYLGGQCIGSGQILEEPVAAPLRGGAAAAGVAAGAAAGAAGGAGGGAGGKGGGGNAAGRSSSARSKESKKALT